MNDCTMAINIKGKIGKAWSTLGFYGEFEKVMYIQSWQDAESYLLLKHGIALEILQNEVISLAGLTNDEISCLYNNLGKEGFAKTGLKAPVQEYMLVEFSDGTVGIIPKNKYSGTIHSPVKGFTSEAQMYVIDNAKTLLGLDLQKLSNAKFKAYYNWMEKKLNNDETYLIKEHNDFYNKLTNQSYKELI